MDKRHAAACTAHAHGDSLSPIATCSHSRMPWRTWCFGRFECHLCASGKGSLVCGALPRQHARVHDTGTTRSLRAATHTITPAMAGSVVIDRELVPVTTKMGFFFALPLVSMAWGACTSAECPRPLTRAHPPTHATEHVGVHVGVRVPAPAPARAHATCIGFAVVRAYNWQKKACVHVHCDRDRDQATHAYTVRRSQVMHTAHTHTHACCVSQRQGCC